VIVYVNKLIILSECILMMYAEIEIEIMQLLHYLCHTCVFSKSLLIVDLDRKSCQSYILI